MNRIAIPLLVAALAGVALAGCATSPQAPADQFSLAEELETVSAQPVGPLRIFSEGTYVVGTDIEPGTYRSTGPVGSADTCYWFRLSDTTGDLDAVLASGSSRGPVTLTVKPSDAAVQSSGCLWSKVVR